MLSKSKTGTFRLSNVKMTVKVIARNGIIRDAAPIVRSFIGQQLDDLVGWMVKMGETTVTVLELHDDAPENRR
jgi:hypothetical protein